ncbi:MAG: hypothetical protein GY696_06750 [Gammaproteobacteria bacterium]|nr:hypothetical protein [Gammaproteobacteria bacterium]
MTSLKSPPPTFATPLIITPTPRNRIVLFFKDKVPAVYAVPGACLRRRVTTAFSSSMERTLSPLIGSQPVAF